MIIFFANKDREAKTRPRVNCDSDHELLIAKFKLKLKKVGMPYINMNPPDFYRIHF